jgi:hypothetical protein
MAAPTEEKVGGGVVDDELQSIRQKRLEFLKAKYDFFVTFPS